MFLINRLILLRSARMYIVTCKFVKLNFKQSPIVISLEGSKQNGVRTFRNELHCMLTATK